MECSLIKKSFGMNMNDIDSEYDFNDCLEIIYIKIIFLELTNHLNMVKFIFLKYIIHPFFNDIEFIYY